MLVGVILLILYAQTNAFDVTGNDYKFKNFAKCFENLGCIETSDEWFDQEHRPINLEPLERHIIRTEFILIKKSNCSDLVYDLISIKKESEEIAGFNGDNPIIFLIHDFTSNGYTGWIKHMALVLLSVKAPCNVISIDWESGAEPPYDQAIANARVVALETITLIHALKKGFNVKEERIHLIGHGLGAHIAGYVGKNFTTLGRITGLDPNGPRFDHMPCKVRLCKKDALFVEVIHTDAFEGTSHGSRELSGQIDFYVNNANDQPNCKENLGRKLIDIDRDYIQVGKILPGCSHKRAFKYFIESLENIDCKFLGLKCHSYQNYLEGKCHNCEVNGTLACAEIGISESKPKAQGIFYVNTGSDSPYCIQPYKVSITMDSKNTPKKGTFEMLMIDDDNQVANISTIDTNLRKLKPGKTHSYLFYASPPQLYNIKEIKLKWHHVDSLSCFAFCDESIYVNEVKITPLLLKRNVTTSILCPVKGRNKIETDNYLTYLKCGTNVTVLTGKNTPIFDTITPSDFQEVTARVEKDKHHGLKTTTEQQ